MALRYTGTASTFNMPNDKGGYDAYASPEVYKRNPDAYVGDYSKPIKGLTREIATKIIAQSKMHSFDEDGSDLEEKITTPEQNTLTPTNSSGVMKKGAE